MNPCKLPEPPSAASPLDLIAGRVRPQVVLLNADYSVAGAEWDTGFELFRQLGLESRSAQRLLPAIEARVEEVVERLTRDRTATSSLMIGGSVIIRVALLQGGKHPQIALFVESTRRREDLKSAAKRFDLTRRQLEVLGLIMQGMSAREIAEILCIAEATVEVYFKQLLQKTAARNRPDMVARVLNWTERSDSSSTLSKGWPKKSDESLVGS
jgi:DNA-binding NarL/FixJ family response regulator